MNDKVFEAIYIKKFPLFLWIILKLKKPHFCCDVTNINGKEYKNITIMKKAFGKLYVMENSYYIDGVLKSHSKLKRIEEYPNIQGLSVRYMSMDESI